MAKTKVETKLHFEVGEKVVICNANISFSGGYYPDTERFTFTTIKEVKEDGSVVVEEGYLYRQAYETSYGYTDVFDYFRINRVPTKDQRLYYFNGKEYRKPNMVGERFSAWLPTYLYKCSQEWEIKAKKIEEEKVKYEAKREANEKEEARKQVFREAYGNEIKPYVERLENAKVKAFRKHICANCVCNRNGYCVQWHAKIKERTTTMCSAFELPKEE